MDNARSFNPEPAIMVTDQPSPDDLVALKSAVVAYNSTHHPYEPARPVAAFVHDSAAALVAGASGTTWWGWLGVDYLWVAERSRGGGLGGRVLATVEAEARRRGCRAAWLDTFSFQAKPFYLRQGYRPFGELPDFPAGESRHFLWKPL